MNIISYNFYSTPIIFILANTEAVVFFPRFWKAAVIPNCEGRRAFPINTIKVHEYNGDKNSTAGRMLRIVGEGGMNLSDANNVLELRI